MKWPTLADLDALDSGLPRWVIICGRCRHHYRKGLHESDKCPGCGNEPPELIDIADLSDDYDPPCTARPTEAHKRLREPID